MKTELLQPALGRESLEEIAMVALEFGRLLMETGASARNVEEITGQVAAGLGAERMDARVGYASLTITLGIGHDWIGCIPMLPGGFATKAILGLFAITAQHPIATNETVITAVDNSLRVMFTGGALGIGLAIPALFLRMRRDEVRC